MMLTNIDLITEKFPFSNKRDLTLIPNIRFLLLKSIKILNDSNVLALITLLLLLLQTP